MYIHIIFMSQYIMITSFEEFVNPPLVEVHENEHCRTGLKTRNFVLMRRSNHRHQCAGIPGGMCILHPPLNSPTFCKNAVETIQSPHLEGCRKQKIPRNLYNFQHVSTALNNPPVSKKVSLNISRHRYEVVIGLTTFAYRYEGLRREDFDEVLGVPTRRGGAVAMETSICRCRRYRRIHIKVIFETLDIHLSIYFNWYACCFAFYPSQQPNHIGLLGRCTQGMLCDRLEGESGAVLERPTTRHRCGLEGLQENHFDQTCIGMRIEG